MDVRLLRTFVAVAESGSFTAAASTLGYTQSAVSQQVAALETSLGVRLFERRPFRLTAAARRLTEHAASILLRVDVATSELAAIERPPSTLVAATPWAAVTEEVGRLLAAGARLERSASAELTVADVDDIVGRVARRACSIGLVDGIAGPGDPLALADPGLLTSIVVRTAPLAVALPADHPLAVRSALGWSALDDARWIDAPRLVPATAPGSTALRTRRLARTRYQGGEPSVLAGLVAAGHGPALVPSWWRPVLTDVRIVPLMDPPWVHRVEALALRSRAGSWADLVGGVSSTS